MRALAVSTRKALSLEKDLVFRLLLVMTMLLGWVSGVFSGGIWGLQAAYEVWQANQSGKISAYLMPESDRDKVAELLRDVRLLQGVEQVQSLDDAAVRALMAPYLVDDSYFPLPVVVEAQVNDSLDRSTFENIVKRHFPTAEIDDPRQLLNSIGTGVRVVQSVTGLMAGVILLIMALLVSLTVRAGLLGQKHSLRVLQYIGATDALVTDLVVRQVAVRSLMGFAGAVVLSLFTLLLAYIMWPPMRPFMSSVVWLAAIWVPFLLVIISLVVAYFTTRKVVKGA